MPETYTLTLNDLIFVAFGKNVVALDRENGSKVWQWKPPKGTGWIALLLDGDRLIVSAHGYMYCLDPMTGEQLWRNDLKGMGTGVPCIASVNGHTNPMALFAAMQQQQQAAAAGAAGAGGGV
ncbi:MAG: PQQ-binding-like beta-propeller repeat protein [Planctomycetaceae bacterium]|nr:PQQ-binding-like beta-propeller repeat protein [Planctomycetaceae bacterium]